MPVAEQREARTRRWEQCELKGTKRASIVRIGLSKKKRNAEQREARTRRWEQSELKGTKRASIVRI